MAGSDTVPSQESIMDQFAKAQTEIRKLQEKNKILEVEVKEEKKETLLLKGQLTEAHRQIENLTEKYGECNKTIGEVQNKLPQQEEEKKYLFNRIELLKRMICERNCVLLAIHFICTYVLGVSNLCCPQLKSIIYEFARKKNVSIEPEDLKCEKFLDVLVKCAIITELTLPGMSDVKSDEIINDAWKQIMSIPEDRIVLILARIHQLPNGIGHVEIFDLLSRNGDSITIYDPQTNSSPRSGNETDFRNYVKNDGGLKLFAVNYDTLKEMLNMFDNILHK